MFTFKGIGSLPSTVLLVPMHVKVPYLNCVYSRLPEDEASGSKHVEDVVEIKVLV